MDEKYIRLIWKELCVYVPAKSDEKNHKFRRIVQNVNGIAYPGDLIGILGSTGVEKSILLQVLGSKASSEVSVTGQIMANGLEITNVMNHVSGYMENNERFFENITIFEHLLYQARLRMDRRLCGYEKYRRINELLNEFQLQDLKYILIRKISKAQKIRLSVVTEMLLDPPILFCDQPTSGLDAGDAKFLMDILRILANSGKIIICTLEQPPARIFDTIDQLWLLAEGQLAFMGTPRGAENFFDSLNYVCPKYFNMADFFVHMLAIYPGREQECRQQIREICFNYTSSYFAKDLANRVDLEIVRIPQNILFMIRNIKQPFWITRTFWLLHRSLLNYRRSYNLQICRLVQIVITGILVGLCFFGTETETQYGIQSTKGILLILVNESLFRSMLSISTTPLHPAVGDSEIFVRETKGNIYSIDSYVVAKIICTLPISALETLIFLSISYWIAGLNSSASIFFYTYLVLFLTSITSTAFAWGFSNLLSNPLIENAMINPIHVFLLLTSGAFISISGLMAGTSWLRFLSWIFYSYESLSIIQFQNITHIWCHPDAHLPCYTNGREVLEASGLSISHFNIDIILIILFYIVFNLIAYFSLLIRTLKS